MQTAFPAIQEKVINMNHAYAVIGAGFGDEGKGLVTDFLTACFTQDNCQTVTVARGNGGAQAGHTVQHYDKRHVFGHVGAGSFSGGDTFLSRQFLVNPDILDREMKALAKIGVKPKIFCDPDCWVTTIYDMAINSLVELSRGAAGRHGSCGMGINETVERCCIGSSFRFSIRELMTLSVIELAEKMRKIAEEWVPFRMKTHGIWGDSEIFRSQGDAVAEKAGLYSSMFGLDRITLINEMRKMAKQHLTLIDTNDWYKSDVMVYEGAQGLGLDEDLGMFPHVTRSITGLQSAIRTARAAKKIDKIFPIYVTRAYATRHGAGPLAFEGVQITGKEIPPDQTNVTNEWQGSFRLAPLNLDLLRTLIRRDLDRSRMTAQIHNIRIEKPVLALTHLDELSEHVCVVMNGQVQQIKSDTRYLYQTIEDFLEMRIGICSSGPQPHHVSITSHLQI